MHDFQNTSHILKVARIKPQLSTFEKGTLLFQSEFKSISLPSQFNCSVSTGYGPSPVVKERSSCCLDVSEGANNWFVGAAKGETL